MANRTTDVNLVIRARNEADRAIGSVADALESLLGDAKGASGGVADLGKMLGALDKTFGAISTKVDTASAAFERQRSAIAENKEQLAAIVAQSENAARALQHLRESIVDEILAGRDQAPIIAQIRQVEQEQAALDAQAGKLTRTIAAQATQIDSSQSSLLKLSATARAVEEGQATAAAEIELTTQAMREQAQAAERVTTLQQRINSVTGVSRPDASGSAAAAASVLAEADNIFRRAEARQAEIQALREQEAATAALADAERAEQANRARFNITVDPRGGQARESAAAFIAAAEAEEQMEREAAQLRAALDPLATIQERFNVAVARYRQLATAGKIGADDLAQAEHRLALDAEQARAALEQGGGGKAALFGLRPYELTNLGYQLNDIATQLASGTSLTQTLGQQGGQILQIFPRVTSAIVGAFTNPAFLGAAAVLGGIIIALKEAGDQAARLREYSSQTNFRADGGSYDPSGLSAAEEGLRRLGATAEQARTVVRDFLADGIAPDRIAQFARAAQETAKVLGTDLVAAASEAASAFTGSYDAVAKLDDKLNFLTASEREHIRSLFEEGNAQAARSEALNAYTRRADDAAAKQRGPWAEAAHSLGAAWHALIGFLADSAPIQLTMKVLNGLAGAVKEVGDAITGALGRDVRPSAGSASNIADVTHQIAALKKEIADYEAAIAAKSPIAGTLQRLVDHSKGQLAAAQAELVRLEANAPDTRNEDSNGSAAKQRSDDLHRIETEDELQRLRDAGQQRLLSAAEKVRREELAGQDAARSAADSVVAAAERRRAIAHETAQIEKETDTRSKAAVAEREKAIRDFSKAVGGAEGGAGQNPNSSAVGIGQLTRATAIGVYRSANPSTRLNDDQIADLRRDPATAQKLVDLLTRQNASFLDRLGKEVNAANLYLVHFLGQGGAARAFAAGPNARVDRIGLSADALGGNQAYLRTEGGQGRYRTVGELQRFLGSKAGDAGSSATQLVASEANLLEEARRKQEAFNLAIRHGTDDRQDSIKALREETALYGTALLLAQRGKAVADADREVRQKAEDANKSLKPGETPVVVTQGQIDAAKELAGALFDAQHAREALSARLADAERPLADLEQQRDLLRDQAEFLRSIGELKAADSVDAQIRAIGGSIGKAYDQLIGFYRALNPEQRVQLGILDEAQLDNIIGKLKLAGAQSQEWGKVLGVDAKQIAQTFASSATSAITNFIQKVAAGQNVFKSLGQSVREFAAQFLQSIAQMILQLLAFAAAAQILRALGVPVPSNVGAGVLHTGGIAGSAGGVQRSVNPAIFAAVMRYHNGGIAGFAPDEVPAILQRNEEVLTTGDPRHRFNGGMNGGSSSSGPSSIKVVNAYDPASVLEHGMSTKAGEKVLLNFVTRNSRAFKAALG